MARRPLGIAEASGNCCGPVKSALRAACLCHFAMFTSVED